MMGGPGRERDVLGPDSEARLVAKEHVHDQRERPVSTISLPVREAHTSIPPFDAPSHLNHH